MKPGRFPQACTLADRGPYGVAAMSNLRLGPIVGHTDSVSSLVWICVLGSIDGWQLRVEGQPAVDFKSTEAEGNEFGTAIAVCGGLESDREYRYEVTDDGSVVARGSFHTMPADGSPADVRFVTLSCNDDREPNAWQALADRIEEHQSRFILMVGDQIYVDEGEEDLWKLHLDSPPQVRRQALVRKHEKLWATEPVASIMANTPVYMTWDDHDIRDGWGSFAGESATLVAQYPHAKPIYERYRAFFKDAADVYYHFQACRNPGRALEGSYAHPFAFRCGRLLVVVLDSRGERDFARPECPILGPEQWQFLDKLVADIGPDVDAIAVAMAVPIVDLDPEGRVHRFFADRTDDIDLVEKGDAEALDELLYHKDNPLAGFVSLVAGVAFDKEFDLARKLNFRVADLDDMRDKWSYASNRTEQERLLRTFARAATAGREPGRERALIFLGGDIHVGAVFQIDMADPPLVAQCVITSGIAKNAPIPEVKGILVDEEFEVAPGIHARLETVLNEVNFAETLIRFADGIAGTENTILTADEDPQGGEAADEGP